MAYLAKITVVGATLGLAVVLGVAWVLTHSPPTPFQTQEEQDRSRLRLEAKWSHIELPQYFVPKSESFEPASFDYLAKLTRVYKVSGTRSGILNDLEALLKQYGYDMRRLGDPGRNGYWDHHSASASEGDPALPLLIDIYFDPVDPPGKSGPLPTQVEDVSMVVSG